MTKLDIVVIHTHLRSQFQNCTVKFVHEEADQLMYSISLETDESVTFSAPYGCCFSMFRATVGEDKSQQYKLILFVQPEAYMNHYKIAADNG